MDLKYKSLLQNNDIYEPCIVKIFQEGAHDTFESWQSRERSVAHDVVCLLLCNTECTPQAPIKMIGDFINLKRKLEIESESKNILDCGPSTSKRAREELMSMQTMEHEEEEHSDESDDEELIDIEDDPTENQKYFRYKLLEGLPNAARLQEHYCDVWKIPHRKKMFDIIDVFEMRFIEFKFSSNYANRLYEFTQDEMNDENNALVVMCPDTAHYDQYNLKDTMPGQAKATNWIMRRKAEMDLMGITNAPFDGKTDLTSVCFTNDTINQCLDEFKAVYNKGTEEKVHFKDLPEMDSYIEIMKPGKLFERLTKNHLFSDDEEIIWTGKLLPSCWKQYTITEGTDSEIINEIFNTFDYSSRESVEGDPELIEALDAIMIEWDKPSEHSKNFGLYDTNNNKNKSKIPISVKNVLGVDMKKKVYNATGNMKQKEFSGIKPRKYAKWFDEMYEQLGYHHGYPGEYCTHFDIELNDRVIMHQSMQQYLMEFNRKIGKTSASMMIGEYSNTFSRLSGSYLGGTGRKSGHSRIALIPLLCNMTKVVDGKDTPIKRYSGMLIRGPCHARSMSDRINIFTIEILNRDVDIKRFQNAAIIRMYEGPVLLLRRNAYKKLDGPYWTFMRNSLFNPANLVGEIILQRMTIMNRVPPELDMAFLRKDDVLNFFANRVVENVLMAVIGNSRDEGYFASARKLLMILICMRRGDTPGSFDINDFCNSCNENIIDNPLSMFLHNSILYAFARLSLG